MAEDSLLTLIPRRSTSQPNAWQNQEYKTYVLNFTIPAVRMHKHGVACTGDWYAVDEYSLSIAAYRRRYAAISKWTDLDVFLLPAGTIVNIGMAGRQAPYPGGGLQFEVLTGGAAPRQIEHVDHPERIEF